MKSRLFISAIYVSNSGTMAGNTRIALEAIRYLSEVYEVVVFTTEAETFRKYLPNSVRYEIRCPTDYRFHKMSMRTHIQEVLFVYRWFSKYFVQCPLRESDLFYSASDFAPDVLPILLLRSRYRFKWIASLYLVIPSIFENVKHGYGFPIAKYLVYFVYQRLLLIAIKGFASGIIVTNWVDATRLRRFPKKRVFAIYGGVNLTEIDAVDTEGLKQNAKVYDAVFCGRLHEQKGIGAFLEVWRRVVDDMPCARLAIIGNGAPEYERYLRKRSFRLGLENNVDWLGYVDGIEKFRIYRSSKIFVHSTVYDNNGMVAAEALCAGLPVIMYDLPSLREVYTVGCVKVPCYDKLEFASRVLEMLESVDLFQLPTEEILFLRGEWAWDGRMSALEEFLLSV